MGGRAKDNQRSELVAAAAVADVLDARLIRRDLPGAHQTRDFDLVFAGDRDPEPLEVTTYASQPDIETWRRLERFDDEIPAPELSYDWHLDVGPPITGRRITTLDVRQLTQDVVALLAVLEASGYQSIDYGRINRDPVVTNELQRLLQLGVDDGRATPPIEPDAARVVFVAPVGGFVHADLVAGGIEHEAGKVDNQKKLMVPAKASRRHLVVVFDGSSGSAFAAAYQGLTGRLPCLPNPITTSWALASGSLLGTTPPHNWDRHRIPERVFRSPEDWLER